MDASLVLVWVTMQRIHEPVIIPSLFQSEEQNLDQVWLSLCENDFLIQYVIFVFLFSVNNCSLLLISQPMLVATKVGSKGDGKQGKILPSFYLVADYLFPFFNGNHIDPRLLGPIASH
jgi:hypothetical protein